MIQIALLEKLISLNFITAIEIVTRLDTLCKPIYFHVNTVEGHLTYFSVSDSSREIFTSLKAELCKCSYSLGILSYSEIPIV